MCSNDTRAKCQTYLYPSKFVSWAFFQSLYSPFQFIYLSPLLFLLSYNMFFTYNLALGQEAVHSRAMSREAMHCARQCCSAIYIALAIFLDVAQKLHRLCNCKLPHTDWKSRQKLAPRNYIALRNQVLFFWMWLRSYTHYVTLKVTPHEHVTKR